MFCTNTGKNALILLFTAMLLIAILAVHASAYTPPYRLMVFTDKQVYLDYSFIWTDPPTINTASTLDTTRGTFEQRVNLFVVLLDSDGNIVRGIPASNITAALRDKERWNHSGPGLVSYPYYTVIPTNGNYYSNISFPIFSDTDNDGIFNSTNDVTDTLSLPAANRPPLTDQLNISVNVTVKYNGTAYKTNVSVIFGNAGCRHARDAGTAHGAGQHDGTVCTVCHWGYQYSLGAHGPNNTIMNSDPERWSGASFGVGDSANWDYKLGLLKTGGNQTTWDNSNAGYCLMCHGGTTAITTTPYLIGNVLDFFSSAPAVADQNSDGISDSNRPSCSWYQGTRNGTTGGYPVCHQPQTDFNGSTKITGSKLFKIDWTAASRQRPGQDKTHNHSISPKTNGIPCELCHAGGGAPGTGTGGMHQVAGLPNRTSDYSNINDQCMGCHNTTDGWLNITSNGGTAKNHSKTNQCGNCHIENNKLDSHKVPTGAYGGKWCLNCHNKTGKAPIDMRIDPAIVNVSNTGYTHYLLNKKSDASNSSRICWGCHTNNSIVRNGTVNSSGLSSDEHPNGFDTPRMCTSCHNNTNVSLSFSAPQTYRHTWYAPDMKTPGVEYCTSCHAQDEMLITWDESVYPPKTENESASHYGRNRTSSFPPIGSREYCAYCHQNENTVMGPFANPNNEVRSDHASQNTTPGCGDQICHKPGRMHEDTLVVPAFNESNIGATCLACHSPVNYSFHNSTLSCWDCHMGNVSGNNPTWIHPIQFIQYNGNFTGAKLTSATCYDCHKSTSVDTILLNLSGKTSPKVYSQAHSNDPANGTKWGDYWKYTPTTYNFASYYVSSGIINPAFPFYNIKVPSNDFMELIENHTGSSNAPVRYPYTKAERQIDGPPVPNWTSNIKVLTGTTTLTAMQDGTAGNPAGSLKATLKTRSSSGTGTVSWNYSFYYRPDMGDYAYTRASVDYNVSISSNLTENVYLRLVKPGGTVVILASASHSSNTGWLTLTNNSFGSALDENGSVAPYIIQLYTEISGSGSKSVQNPYSVNFDNILLEFQEKVWNRYEIVINTTGIPVNGSSKLGMSYQTHIENAYLLIYNKTSRVYETLDLLDKGVFFDYVKDIDSRHHIDSKDGITGNVSVKFVDIDQNFTDAVTDKLHIRYLYVYTDQGLQYPCEQCHSPNKHYVTPTIGSPEKFRAGNKYNNSDLVNSTWCQQCHWQRAVNYSKMIQEFNVTRNPPENIPPEITGNKSYGNFTTSKDGITSYVNHSGSAYSDMNDSGCFKCHGKIGDSTTAEFIHNVQIGQSGNRQCVTCHNANTTNYKKVDVEAVRRGMHGSLKNSSANTGNTSDPVELACWACHGDGVYNDPDQHRNTNAWTCDKCHTNTAGKLNYTALSVSEHIPPGFVAPEADIITRFNNTAWACADCHNNSINSSALMNDNENDPNSARVGHYGQNRTAGKLLYDFSTPPKGNSEDCIYCHNGNSAEMTKWGVDPLSTKNLSNKISPTDHRTYTNSNCGSCHNYTVSSDLTFHNSTLTNGSGSAGGSDCIACHDTGGSVNNVNFSAFGGSMHATVNSGAQSTPQNIANRPCWGCHGTKIGTYANESDQPSGQHNNTYYRTPRKCNDCHITGNLQFTNKNVTDHIPAGFSGNTDVSVPFYCSLCHNNSVNIGYEPDGMGITDGSPINASVSHYGANRSANRLMAQGSNSTDCVYCHRNNSNMIQWGIAQGSLSNISNKNASGGGIDHDPYSASNDCILCHGGYAVTGSFTFHNSALGAGIGSSPDCKSCHDAGGSVEGKLVNFSAMNNTNAIHRNLNIGAPASVNIENRKCWACHDEGSEPSGHNNSRYKTPYKCEDCHTQSGAKSSKYPGWNVTEHVKAGTVIGTELFTPQAGNCYSCHNISEMMVGKNLDPDGASMSIYGGENGGSNSSSHYGKKRNLGTGDVYCNYCHNNASTSFGFDDQHNKKIFEHTGNSTADVRNTTTMECIDCHTTNAQSYRIHNSTLNTPIASEWTAGREDRCAPCHKSSGAGSTLKVNNSYHNTTTGNITDCSYCHNSESLKSSSPQNIHSDNLTKGGNSSYNNCYNCHQNGFTSFAIIEHSNNTNANITNASMTCEKSGCHNSNKTHSRLMIKPLISMWTQGGNDYCAPCHNSSDSVNNATKKIYNKGHDPAGKTNDNITSCANCHYTSTPGAVPSSFKLHDSQSTNLTGRNESTCSGCHNGTTAYVGLGKQVLSHMPNASQYRGNTSDSGYTCELCHNMTGKISMHSAGMNRSSGTCDTCHFNNTSPFKSLTKNITLLAGGMVNHSYDGRDRNTCNTSMCHNASGRAKLHLSKYAAGDIADPQDPAGNPTFFERATWSGDSNDRGLIVDCRDCHEKYNDTAPFFAPFQEANMSGVNNQEHVGKGYKLTNCYVCHTYEDNVSKPATMHNISIEPLTGGPACKKCHDVASVNRTLDNKLWMNVTAFNSTNSVHRSFINVTLWNGSNVFEREDTACWVCHQSDGKQPERHTDKKDEAYKAYRCPDCHVVGGIAGTYQPRIYDNAMKLSKHYPGSVFLNEMVFSGSVSCSICHNNSIVANTDLVGYPNSSKANDIDVSHYGTRQYLLNTTMNLKRCQECHGVKDKGSYSSNYGNAPSVPDSHNTMGSTSVDCELSCHNSAIDVNNYSVPVVLHNNSVGVYLGSNACNSPGCHTPPEPGEETR